MTPHEQLKAEIEACLRAGPSEWTIATGNLSEETRWLVGKASGQFDIPGAVVAFKNQFGSTWFAMPDPSDSLRQFLDILSAQAADARAWEQGLDPTLLMVWPAAQLVSLGGRMPIGTKARWAAAGGKLVRGKMAARKDDPVWRRFSQFGQPYPPYDWDSIWEIGVEDVSASEFPASRSVISASKRLSHSARPQSTGCLILLICLVVFTLATATIALQP